MKRILVAEDEEHLREGIAAAFGEAGHEVVQAKDGGEAVQILDEQVFDLVVTDYKMPTRDGIDVLRRARLVDEKLPVVMMTAYGTVEHAVEAMRLGAYDYVQKPFQLEELELKAAKALEHGRLLRRLESLDRRELIGSFDRIVGESPGMKRIFEIIRKVAPSNATVLVLGETGTGKELIAEAIHRSSGRRDGPFVKTNCAALHEELLESELFGHERGAFTGADRQRIGRFELANEGTLFLDEIGSMSASTQSKVLRVLQEREFERLGGTRTIKVDVRLVAATNKDLETAIESGEFREDLYYRLNVVQVQVPPLRQRKEDIVPLANHFLQRYANELNSTARAFAPAALKLLMRHHWPGNIRELENAVERAVLMTEGTEITTDDLTVASAGSKGAGGSGALLRLPPDGIPLDELEKHAILEALRMNNWVQKDAARFLGISSRVMNYKVQKYEITHDRWTRNRAEQLAEAE
jgi:DNA-binding NtrC family response regulator